MAAPASPYLFADAVPVSLVHHLPLNPAVGPIGKAEVGSKRALLDPTRPQLAFKLFPEPDESSSALTDNQSLACCWQAAVLLVLIGQEVACVKVLVHPAGSEEGD